MIVDPALHMLNQAVVTADQDLPDQDLTDLDLSQKLRIIDISYTYNNYYLTD